MGVFFSIKELLRLHLIPITAYCGIYSTERDSVLYVYMAAPATTMFFPESSKNDVKIGTRAQPCKFMCLFWSDARVKSNVYTQL